MSFLSFPMHLQENGLLRRSEGPASVLALLQMMARTPAGSWQGCAAFGLRDLFEQGRQRADTARQVAERINDTLRELGVQSYAVTEVIREVSQNRDVDTYVIVLENAATAETIRTSLVQEI